MKTLILVLMPCLIGFLVIAFAQMSPGQEPSQYPIADRLADKLIQKYQTSSCQQLQQEKQQPPTGEKAAVEQRAIQALHQDPQMREHFLNKVAAPIVNKLFECGFIP